MLIRSIPHALADFITHASLQMTPCNHMLRQASCLLEYKRFTWQSHLLFDLSYLGVKKAWFDDARDALLMESMSRATVC